MMSSPLLSLSRRVRQTPFSKKNFQHGASSFTVYNHMLLPTVFETLEADYHHLKQHVQIWDVACERQVQICGRDSTRLIHMLTPRNLEKLELGKCFYAPVVDEKGGMLNDPVFLKLAPDKYWISISDSDLLLWIKGLAYGFGLDVVVEEPDVSLLAIQGPKSYELAARVFGESIHDINFFNFSGLTFKGYEVILARSGFSKQGGFEIFVEGPDIAEPLWDALFEAGENLNVRAGCPNLIERIESRLLSYGNDMTRKNNPYECGLEKFCHPEFAVNCVGRDALLKILSQGPQKKLRSFSISGARLNPATDTWPIYAERKVIGEITSVAWSPDFDTNVAIGMINVKYGENGNRVEVGTPEGTRESIVQESSFN